MTRRRRIHDIVNPSPAVPHDLSHHVVDETRAGEWVGIAGEHGTYRILREVMNVNNGAEWVELMGGSTDPNNTRQYRTVRPDRLTKRRAPRGRA